MAVGQGVTHRIYGYPMWAFCYELGLMFHTDPMVFMQWEPNRLKHLADFLEAYGRGKAVK